MNSNSTPIPSYSGRGSRHPALASAEAFTKLAALDQEAEVVAGIARFVSGGRH
jgi:hypothetical protein